MQNYATLASKGNKQLIIQRSRFICQANHVPTVEAAQQFIAQIQRRAYDATHNCYAYRINAAQQKSSDDGEPAGTAGRPILETILQHELWETVIVITRYFGGIKLGAGGLVRAYREAAQLAIQTAGIAQKQEHQEMICNADFALWGKLEHHIRATGYLTDPPLFTDHVSWSIWVPVAEATAFYTQMIDWSQGQLQIARGGLKYIVT